MEFTKVLSGRRSIRKYTQDALDDSTLLELIRAASQAPSAANRQILRYEIVRSEEKVGKIFELTFWGGHVRPKRNPEYGKTSPKAFIAVWTNPDSEGKLPETAQADAGAAIENMLLRATDLGLGSCWLGAFDRKKTAEILKLPEESVLYLAAFGYPAEAPVFEWITTENETKYYIDGNDRLHVPKYAPEDISHFI